MPTTTLENRLSLLRQQDPELAERLESWDVPEQYVIKPSRQGTPTVVFSMPDASPRALHSGYDPVQEASRFIDNIDTAKSAHYLVLGLGLGYHILELIRRIPRHSTVLVVEPDLALARLALTHAPLDPVLKYPGLKLFVGQSAEEVVRTFEPWKTAFTLNGFTPVRFQSLLNTRPDYFKDIEHHLAQEIRTTQVDHNTQAALSKFFYQNCLDNLPVARQTPGIVTLQNQFQGTPAIVVSAGPSLDKNINLLKGAKGRGLVIAVATALKPLKASGIAPDFVVAIDPNEISVSAFDAGNLTDSGRLVFHPCIPQAIVDLFPGRRMVTDADLFFWKYLTNGSADKGSLGKSFSVAHAALKFARCLGCDPIILVGQDLAFDGPRSHCSGSHHADLNQQHMEQHKTEHVLNHDRRLAAASAIRWTHDMFGNTTATNQALDAFRMLFAEELDSGGRVYNATEGGVPIPGIQNLTLKEALHLLPPKAELQIPPSADQGTNHSDELSPGFQHQAQRLAACASSYQEWLERHDHPINAEDIRIACDEAEDLLQRLIADHVTIQLLQEYLFAEFMEWNRGTYQIGLLDPEREEAVILQARWNRDRNFFPHLVKGAHWLETVFTHLAANP